MRNKGICRKILMKIFISILYLFSSTVVLLTGFDTLAIGESSSQTTVSQSPLLAPINSEFLAWQSEKEKPDFEKTQLHDKKGHAFGYIPSPFDWSHVRLQKAKMPMMEILPSSYDLRSLGYVTSVKDQGWCGSCWAFATYGSLESWLLKNESENRDFSENHLKNYHGFDNGPCDGGNDQMSTAYLTRWSGPVNESDDPYHDWDDRPSPGGPYQKYVKQIIRFTTPDEIKNAIMTYGALLTYMYYDDAYYDSFYHTYYYNGSPATNHAVTVVGWDDEKFVGPGPGVWIIKNSWGSWGENGFFYISYYDSVAVKQAVTFSDSVTNWEYMTNYQYDPLGQITSCGWNNNTAWGANIFTPLSDELLGGIGFYALAYNTEYEINVYDNFDGSTFSGLMGSTSGTLTYPGYHTIDLPSLISLTNGDDFGIVIKFTTPGYNYPIPIEKPISGYSSNATANAGESFISSNGMTFTDIRTWYPNTNVCIKGFTVPPSNPPPEVPSDPNPADGATEVSITTDILDWADSTYALAYDLYFWKSTESKPVEPTARDLRISKYNLLNKLTYSTTYNWQVIAKNKSGSIEGPLWSFSTPTLISILTTSFDPAILNQFYTMQLKAEGGSLPYLWSLIETSQWNYQSLPIGGTFPSEYRGEGRFAYNNINDNVYLFGGFKSDTSYPFHDHAMNYFYKLNINTWQWSQISDSGRPSGRVGHGLVFDSARNRILLFGGGYYAYWTDPETGFEYTYIKTHNDADRVYVFNIATNTWSTLATLGTGPGRRDGIAAVYNSDEDALYIDGGAYTQDFFTWSSYSDTYRLDLGTNTWSVITGSGTNPRLRYDHDAWIYQGRLGIKTDNKIFYLDLQSGKWENLDAVGNWPPDLEYYSTVIGGSEHIYLFRYNHPVYEINQDLGLGYEMNQGANFPVRSEWGIWLPNQDYVLLYGDTGRLVTLQQETMPPGLMFSDNGLISGTPTQMGNFPLTLKVSSFSDSANWDFDNFNLIVGPPLPDAPSSPSPADGITNVSISINLDWSDSLYADSYDIYLWKSSEIKPPIPSVSDITTSAFDPPDDFDYSTTYNWQIIAKNSTGTASGQEWSFTTQIAPPEMPSSPDPPDGAIDVNINTTLSWSSCDRVVDYVCEIFDSNSNVCWYERYPQQKPSPRRDHAMVYNTAKGNIVLFGGEDGSDKNDTWEWNGTNWLQKFPVQKPSARERHAMAYDTIRGKAILFSGYATTNDTWEWDGTNWSQKFPTDKPSARSEHAMAYDSAREKIVLFGGYSFSDETWEWDGTNWSQKFPTDKPSARYGHAMAYDAAKGKIVLFGGIGGGYRDDTWEWDGINWTQLFPTQKPSARSGHKMAYDTVRGRIILFGGYWINDTWEWDGNNWIERHPSQIPPQIGGHAMVYDEMHSSIILFGGYDNSSSYKNDTWELFLTPLYSEIVTDRFLSMTFDYEKTYFWRVIARNQTCETIGPLWSFTTLIAPPEEPTSPSPADLSTNISIATNLDWSNCARATSYDLYFWKATETKPSTPTASDLTVSEYDPVGNLDYATEYKWQVIAKNTTGNTLGAEWRFTTQIAPPEEPFTPLPTDTSTNISITTNLDWSDSARATSYDLYFWKSSDVKPSTPTASDLTISEYDPPSNLDYATEYKWQVIAKNTTGNTPGAEWIFTTQIAPPEEPTSPSPADLSINISITTNLDWSDSARATSYDLYFWKSSDVKPSTPTASNLTVSEYDPPGNLDYATEYKWQVIAKNTTGNTPGAEWRFTTQIAPPEEPSSPLPTDTSTNISITTNLDWADSARATSYDLYFWKSSDVKPSTPTASDLTVSEYDPPGNLEYYTEYKWQVVAKNITGNTSGPEWGLTTQIATPEQPFSPNPPDGATNIIINPILTWASCARATDYVCETFDPIPIWNQVSCNQIPSARSSHAMTCDSARGKIVLFGGYDGSNKDDMWEWDGTNWMQMSPAQTPSKRSSHAMAYDSARGKIVLFGGSDGSFKDDTWEWDGTKWTEVLPTQKPSARIWHAMAYDSTRGRIVLFGGFDGSNKDDMWEWDGINWTQIFMAQKPSPMYLHAMAYDEVRKKIVLFGQYYTWEWNGISWTQLNPVQKPSSWYGHAMTYDSARGKIVLFGGSGVGPYKDETWEWDGTNWTQIFSIQKPSGRYLHAMAYDSARGKIVLFGGQDGTSIRDDTWELFPYRLINSETVTEPSLGVMLDYEKSYLWRVIARNQAGNTIGPFWSFTTQIAPPEEPSTPLPTDTSTNISIATNLDWSDCARATSYDIYFWKSADMKPITPTASDLTVSEYDPVGNLDYATEYKWQVIAKNTTGNTPGAEWKFTTQIAPPEEPTSPSPADLSTNISIATNLDWSDSARATSYDLYFWKATETKPSTPTASDLTVSEYDPVGNLDYATEYKWQVIAKNTTGNTPGAEWKFTTQIAPPEEPTSPSPADLSTNISITTNLDWADSARATSYDLYLWKSSGVKPVTPTASDLTVSEYDPPSNSDYATEYKWQVIAKNTTGNTPGAEWTFTTQIAPPEEPSTPLPADTSTNISIVTNLDWSDSARATSYDLYFWKSSDVKPSTPTASDLTVSEYDPPSNSDYATEYKWQVIAKNTTGNTPGAEWKFTTCNLPSAIIDTPVGDQEILTGDSINFSGTATGYNLTYLWKFDGAAPDSNQEDPGDIIFNQHGLYTIIFGVKDQWQNYASDSVKVIVKDPAPDLVSLKLLDQSNFSEEETDSQLIKVEIETTGSEPTHIMLSEKENFDGASWQLIQEPIIFRLSSKNGQKTVYAKVGGIYVNESNILSDSIILNTDDYAQIVSDTIPSEMSPSQTYKVSITLHNTGASIWPQGWDLYRLGAVGDSDPLGGNKRYPMPKDVYPDDNVTIEYYLTAPTTTGTYTTDWRMVKEWEHWFGEKLVKQVTVKEGLKRNNSKYIVDYIPEEVSLKQSGLFIITFKNTGNATWTKTGLHKLGISGDRQQLGCPGRVELTNDVFPGEETTFNFWVTPIQEGEYTITIRMLQEYIEWFGESAIKTIKVVKYTEVDNTIFELYE